MKFVAGMLSSLALAAGLLLTPASVGSANAAACSYAPTVGTVTSASRLAGNAFSVTVNAGSVRPNSALTVRVVRVSDGKVVKTISTSYWGGTKKVSLGNFVVGRKFRANFIANPKACKYKSSRTTVIFRAK